MGMEMALQDKEAQMRDQRNVGVAIKLRPKNDEVRIINPTPYRVSETARRKMADVDRRSRRVFETAHKYWFD